MAFSSFFSFLNPKTVRKWFHVENIFVNYFWFYTLCSISVLILHQSFLINLGFPIVILLFFLKQKKSTILNGIDVLIVVCFCWIFCTWITNDFPHKYYIIGRSFFGEIAFMLAYWIGRCSKINYIKLIVENARKPLVITCLIGIYCYFFEPTWYLSIVDEAVSSNTSGYYTKESVLDQFKLRSIFSGGYVLGYMCAIALVYELFLLFTHVKKEFRYYNCFLLYILLLLVTSIFALMRAPMACSILGMFMAYFYSLFYANKIHSTKILLFIMIFFGLSITFLIHFVDFSTIELLYSKLEDISGDDGGNIYNRLFLQAQSFTLCGEGFGKYNAIVHYKFGMPSIPDGEYMKIISEQGFIGIIITFLLFGGGLLKAIRHFKYLYFEFFIILMLLVCMIGADPLSTSDKHCFIYWLALGQISRFSKKNKYEKNKSYSNVPAPVSPNP